jgi:hypothetical protein
VKRRLLVLGLLFTVVGCAATESAEPLVCHWAKCRYDSSPVVLLAPPMAHNHVVPSAPIAQWTMVGTYPDWSSCADARNRQERYGLGAFTFGEDLGDRNPRDGYLPRCLRTDDPDLGGNAPK